MGAARDEANTVPAVREAAVKRRCCWCRDVLVFSPTGGLPGWVHEATGKTYATYFGPDSKERDDHCALPDWSDSGALSQGAPA